MNILVVEDHRDTRSILERLLARSGFDVCATGTVKGARKLLDHFRFDAVLSVIGLPDGDGYEVVAEAKKRQSLQTAVAMTAYSGVEDRARAVKAGFDHFLVKPLDVRRLRTVFCAST